MRLTFFILILSLVCPLIARAAPPLTYSADTSLAIKSYNFLIKSAKRDSTGTHVTYQVALPDASVANTGYKTGMIAVVQGMTNAGFNTNGSTITALTPTSVTIAQNGTAGASAGNLGGTGIISAVPAVKAANTYITDPYFGTKIFRMTDANSDLTGSDFSFHTSASAEANIWNANSTKFVVIENTGKAVVFNFDPSTMKATLDTAGTGSPTGVVPSLTGTAFSFTQPNRLYMLSQNNTFAYFNFSDHSVHDLYTLGDDGVTNPCKLPQPLTPKSVDPVNWNDSLDAVTVGWDTQPGLNTRIALASGGQDQNLWKYAIVYDVSRGAQGCRWFDVSAGRIGGQWGPLCGGPGQQVCPGAPAAGTMPGIHNVQFTKDAKYLIITGKLGPVAWEVATGKVYTCDGDIGACSGHRAVSFDEFATGGMGNYWTVAALPCSGSTCTTYTMGPKQIVAPRYDSGFDNHSSWNNARAGYNIPFLSDSYTKAGVAGLITAPQAAEIKAVSVDGTNRVYRFAHNFTDGFQRDSGIEMFWWSARGNVDPSGRFFLFTSNMLQTLGTDNTTCSNGKPCPRHDVFLVPLR